MCEAPTLSIGMRRSSLPLFGSSSTSPGWLLGSPTHTPPSDARGWVRPGPRKAAGFPPSWYGACNETRVVEGSTRTNPRNPSVAATDAEGVEVRDDKPAPDTAPEGESAADGDP